MEAKDFRIAVIDGTGAWSDATYEREMQNSFCSQIARQTEAKSRYWRGPSFDGIGVGPKADEAAEWLQAELECSAQRPRLFLAGYSRGASAAILAAERLQPKGVKIEGMFLFDPVARHTYSGGEVIPANVSKAYVVRRLLEPALVKKYEKGGRLGRYFPTTNPIRPWFGTTAVQHLGPGACRTQEFRGSHGALGGVGWKEVSEDEACQLHVADWMSKALRAEGLPVYLTSFAPAG